LRAGAGAGARCVPNLYVDGLMVRMDGGDFSIDNLVRGERAGRGGGVRHPQVAPGEFPPFENRLCGVVVIWTEVTGDTSA
jgi:hypothetical protein